ncbi:MAG: glycosyltransferase [Verrucomicrobiales bacterium]
MITALGAQGVEVIRHCAADGPKSLAANPDLAHIHGIWSPALMRRFFEWRKRGVPCLVTVHGMLEPWALAHKPLKKKLAWHIYQKWWLDMAAALHATSEREAMNLRKLGLRPPIAMIPWGVEIPEDRGQWTEGGVQEEGEGGTNIKHRTFNVEHRTVEERCDDRTSHTGSSTAQRHRNTEAPKHRTALFVGRIYPVKGLPLLVEAWARVRPEGWKMRIVGPDEAGHRVEVVDLVRKAGLEAEFEFAGPMEGEQLEKAYQEADLLIAPSHTENFGMAIAEALAHGLPVITTQGAPWPGLLEHQCGWWPPTNAAELAVALREATSLRPEQLGEMGDRGRRWMQRDYAWTGVARQFLDVYECMIGKGQWPGCVMLP